MNRKRTGLGRGLDALIPGSESVSTGGGVQEIPVGSIIPNPKQPRKRFDPEELAELAASIKEHGIIQPLVLAPAPQGNQYILIAGERRLQAARQAGLITVPAVIRNASEQQFLELAIIENVQRADLSPLEAARAFKQLHDDFGLTQEAIATRVGKSRAAVANTMRLLNLSLEVQQALADNVITEGHARAMLALSSDLQPYVLELIARQGASVRQVEEMVRKLAGLVIPLDGLAAAVVKAWVENLITEEHVALLRGLEPEEKQTAVLQSIIKQNLTPSQTQELIRKLSGTRPAIKSHALASPEIKALEEELQKTLGTRVTLQDRQGEGSLVIHYYSREELDALIARLLGS